MAQTALITGASAGLGREYAKLFARDHCDLVLVARRQDRLEALASELSAAHAIRAHVVAEDLSDPGAPGRILQEVNRLGLEIDFLVNNAGAGWSGAFVEGEAGQELRMVQLNVGSLLALTRGLLPGMIARRRGRILNLGSTAGFQPGPYMAVYYASKAFVNSFTEALWYELRGTGVTATVSCPGATATEFAQVAGTQRSRLFQLVGAMDAQDVALAGYRAMQAGKSLAIHGMRNKLMMATVRMSPRAWVRWGAAFMNSTSRNKPPPQLSS